MTPSPNAWRAVRRLLRSALALAAVLPAAVHAAPPGSDTSVVPLTTDGLLALYLARHPELRRDPAFARDWTGDAKCAAWTRLFDDEFKASPFLRASAAELAGTPPTAPSAFVMRVNRFLGRYDAAKGEFALETLGGRPTLALGIRDYRGEQNFSSFSRGCEPSSGSYPLEYDVRIDNPGVANGVPMTPDQAEAYARSRTSPGGVRDTSVTVVLTLRLTMGEARPAKGTTKGVIVPVDAHIVDVSVEDATSQHRVFYRADAARLRAGEAEAEATREDERLRASVPQLTRELLAQQFREELDAPKVGDKPARLSVDLRWSQRGDSYRFPMEPSVSYRISDISLGFDNAAEVAALVPNPALTPSFVHRGGGGGLRVSLTYVPVGAFDDELKGGKVLVGHVLSVDTLTDDGGPERLVVTATSSRAVPWTGGVRDARLATDFDVLGIKTGMSPAEVQRVAKAALGQTLTFEEDYGRLRSPAEECQVTFADDAAPAVGRRCLVGTFLKPPGGSGWALARLEYSQTLPGDQIRAAGDGLKQKYGKADFYQSYPGRFAGQSLRSIPTEAAGWGARLTDGRPGPDGVPFPLHPVEAVFERALNVLALKLTLTDLAAFTAVERAKAAEAAQKASGVAPKF